MVAHSVIQQRGRRKGGGSIFMTPLTLCLGLMAAAGCLVVYLLWPTWPSAPIPFDAPSIPVTVAGVLFEVPPAAIRVAVERTPGPQQRLDLVFLWPSLKPPAAEAGKDTPPAIPPGAARADAVPRRDRLYVTIDALASALPPQERLRSIYPRYVEAKASAGPDGLAVLPFRAGTPYDGQDIVYVSANPQQFFALCTRQTGLVPGTCMHERAVDAAVITLRFPRTWLDDWRNSSIGFDRLIAQLHPPGH